MFQKKKTLLKESVNGDPHHYGQFALSLGKESPYVFSKLTYLIRTSRYYGHYRDLKIQQRDGNEKVA